MLLFKLGQSYDPKHVKVLVSHLSKLEKLQEKWLVA